MEPTGISSSLINKYFLQLTLDQTKINKSFAYF